MILVPLKEMTYSSNVYPKAVVSPMVVIRRQDSPIVPIVWVGKDLELGKKKKKKKKTDQPNLPLLYKIPTPSNE